MTLENPSLNKQNKNLVQKGDHYYRNKRKQQIKQKLQKDYDSSLTESMPNPSSELSEDVESEASSCLQDEEEGIAQKPNVFNHFNKITSSEKKTANTSEIVSQNNVK